MYLNEHTTLRQRHGPSDKTTADHRTRPPRTIAPAEHSHKDTTFYPSPTTYPLTKKKITAQLLAIPPT